MSDYDAIVIGAGHNGLTAAAILQRGGLRTLCLEKNHYYGGMAATVELFDGYRFEIAGSVLFPTPAEIFDDLGLGACQTIDSEVMSVNIGRPDDEPIIFYSDPERMMNHVAERHGADAMMGMAGLLGWSEAPGRAIGRFDVRRGPRTLDEMYACATNEDERLAIREVMFGSVMDVVGRFLPDKEKHKMLRGLLAFLAVNSTYRGPYTPGSAACLAFALASPPDTRLMQKLDGGIGALGDHLKSLFESHGGELRLRSKVKRILTSDGRVQGVELQDGDQISAPVVLSNLDPSVTFTQLMDPDQLPADLVARLSQVDHRAAYVQMHFALDGLPEYAAPNEFLNTPSLQGNLGLFGSPEEMQADWEGCRRGVLPQDPSMGLQIPSIYDPSLAPEGKHAASAFAFYFPVEVDRSEHGRLKDEMAERVIAKMTRLAPNFRDLIIRHTTFASFHMETMFGCPGGDFCHGLIHPELMGPFRPGPRGWIDLPIPVEGLYLCGAGCYGGPGVTFTPGYNAGYEVLDRA
ncbi:MAG: phytoene desaturase family protein [Acidimicrobiales bacterium]